MWPADDATHSVVVRMARPVHMSWANLSGSVDIAVDRPDRMWIGPVTCAFPLKRLPSALLHSGVLSPT